MLLGDGRKSQKNFYIQCPARDEDYLLYKKEVLEKITRKPVIIRQTRNRQGNKILRLEPKLIPLTRVLVSKLYKGGTKTITRKFLNLLTPQGIAIWFCDRGSKSFKKKRRQDPRSRNHPQYLSFQRRKRDNRFLFFTRVGISVGTKQK